MKVHNWLRNVQKKWVCVAFRFGKVDVFCGSIRLFVQIINRIHFGFSHSSNLKWCYCITIKQFYLSIVLWHRPVCDSKMLFIFFRSVWIEVIVRCVYYYFVYLQLIKMKRSNRALKIINSHERERLIHTRCARALAPSYQISVTTNFLNWR